MRTRQKITLFETPTAYVVRIEDCEGPNVTAIGEDENPMLAFGKAQRELERQGRAVRFVAYADPADWEEE